MDGVFRFHPYGDSALVVNVAEEISEENYLRIRGLAEFLGRRKLAAVKELVPSYRSLLVVYDPLELDYASLEAEVKGCAEQALAGRAADEEIVVLPVCYEPAYGFDLEEVALHSGMGADEVVGIHSSIAYRVYMLGFTPGFPYLGGMSERIAAPRRASPRTSVPAGSVGIADRQTGVYPMESPGGWNIIGRTPARLFDPRREEPTLLRAGQFVRFAPITSREYAEIEIAQRAGSWAPKVERKLSPEGAA